MRCRTVPWVLACLLGSALWTNGVVAQSPGGQRRGSGATISGFVRDKASKAPLAVAWAQLPAAEGGATVARNVYTDMLGHFASDVVADGRYLLGFTHPLLDSLGVDVPAVR